MRLLEGLLKYTSTFVTNKRVKVFKNEPSKIGGKQPLKNLKFA